MKSESKILLEEYIEEIRECLPTGANVAEWINDADRFEILEGLSYSAGQSLCYQWGRLLGAAEFANLTVWELLDCHGVEVPNV